MTHLGQNSSRARPKPKKQRLIDSGFGELLVLLSQNVAHGALTEKLEALHGQVRALFAVAHPTAASDMAAF
jgi:hypothetical protein